MAGIEFKVPRSDHRKVEDFVATRPEGLGGIQLEVTNLPFQRELVAAVENTDLEVTIDPLTERLCFDGFNPERIPFGDLYPVDLLAMHAANGPRVELTERLVEFQAALATKLVPAHFFVADFKDLTLNVSLVRLMSALAPDRPLRPILAVSGQFLQKAGTAKAIAREYRQAGISEIELRISPLGGQDEGPLKIRRTLTALAEFKHHGVEVMLGSSGVVGHAALALGLADGFSVGIGYREKYNHKEAIGRQVRLADDDPEEDEDEKARGPRGAIAGVYVPGAEVTVTRSMARTLYDDPAVRRYLGCRIGTCASSVNGPLLDPRGHYLHAQAAAVAETLDRPATWRPTLLRDRLVRAREVREQIFHVLPNDVSRPKARTLTSLADEINRYVSHAQSA